MDWTKITSEIGIFGVFASLIVWLIKQLGQSFLDKNVKRYELELQNKSDLYKSELEKQSQKYKRDLNIHLTKVSRFHEKRLETISELYKLIVQMKRNLSNLSIGTTITLLTGDKKKDIEFKNQREIEVIKSYYEFINCFDQKRIFIPKNACKSIDILKKEFSNVLLDYHLKEKHSEDLGPELRRQILRELKERDRETIPSILNELESNFRKTIDVENEVGI